VRWLQPVQRRRRRRLPVGPILLVLALLGAAAGAYAFVRTREEAEDPSAATAQRFAAAWARGDLRTAWRLTAARTRTEETLGGFRESNAQARRAATVTKISVGQARAPRNGVVAVPVVVRTRLFGVRRGTIAYPVVRHEDTARVVWDPSLRLPGLRAGEAVRRRTLRVPEPAHVLAASGNRLSRYPGTAELVTNLRRTYRARLRGRPGAELRYGRRVIVRARLRRPRSVRTTIRPELQRAAVAALGGRFGGIAVVRPRTGDVLGVSGLGLSGPQPPGSTFKIITLSAALRAGVASPSSSYPVRTQAVLSGVPLQNASGELCGGSLAVSFAHSCNSVFAPLGAKLGRKRLVGAATAFGFNQPVRVPGAKRSTIHPDLKDDLAVGAAAIGQERDLATALGMASVGATIAAGGVHAAPRVVRADPVKRRRAVPVRVAHQVRGMMVGVVQGGTGTAAALPGVEVAGKTGTAELRPTAGGPSDPRNTDAWFVAFAPARSPRLAVAVMLVGAGAGGAAAAPLARQVLAAGV
jgi:cell division protein FtsI/penicillin-binding protein 2